MRDPPHGWDGAEPWLPFPPASDARSVEAMCADPGSILHLYRRLLAARRASPQLRQGSWDRVEAPIDVLAYRRSHAMDERLVAINFADQPRQLTAPDSSIVDVASDSVGAGGPFGGWLGPEQALIMWPGSG